jgi:hydrogenase maturation protease
MTAAAMQTLVLGIGNVLWADEGFGVRAVEAFHEHYAVPDEVRLLDGGTQGLYLLEDVCASTHVLVFDAIDFRLAPATLRVLRDGEVPAWAPPKMSLHQASFQEILAIARLRDRLPQHVTLIGVQPVLLADFGGSLTPPVRARVSEAVELAAAELANWGVACTRRASPPAERLNDAAIALHQYEAGRPSAADACRIGDDRFLNLRHARDTA